MGPTLISDKSFIQSLTVDESVWLDNFFINIICPTFFSETLADLSKSVRNGRTPEQEVRIVSSKTPEMSIAINAFHKDLCIANLGGYHIKMDRRPLVPGGKPVETGNEKGVVFETPPEQLAFSRWQDEKFLELEKDYDKWGQSKFVINGVSDKWGQSKFKKYGRFLYFHRRTSNNHGRIPYCLSRLIQAAART